MRAEGKRATWRRDFRFTEIDFVDGPGRPLVTHERESGRQNAAAIQNEGRFEPICRVRSLLRGCLRSVDAEPYGFADTPRHEVGLRAFLHRFQGSLIDFPGATDQHDGCARQPTPQATNRVSHVRIT